jgi:predicted DNA repair protein MutK
MSIGLIALLDDVAALAKVAAASLDDVAGQAAQAGAKAAGVVIDDTAVTPRYVTGFAPSRELPIIGRIAVGSLKNKLLYLLPAALVLSLAAPQAITPLLMIGGAYLCYEGVEKIYHAILPHAAQTHEAKLGLVASDAASFEDQKVAGAIKTDFILSAEIMAITLATVPDAGLITQALVLAAVGIGITLAVYGVVALIVKADDAGVALARAQGQSFAGMLIRLFGRLLAHGTTYLLQALSVIGTAAMIWVGGGIILHGLEGYGLGWLSHMIHEAAALIAGLFPPAGPLLGWLVEAVAAGLAGLAIGLIAIPVTAYGLLPLWQQVRSRLCSS